jgi:dephospho-CoA kinase
VLGWARRGLPIWFFEPWYILFMNNYLIEGISGTGKTEVCNELKKRGYKALEADEVFGFYGDPKTGKPTEKRSQLNWLWNKKKVDEKLSKEIGEPIFVCGGAMNQNEFTHYFNKTFTLRVDDDALRERLLNRTNNDFGKHPDDLARQLEWNKGVIEYSRQRGTILIDAAKPINVVVDEILSYVLNNAQAGI